jgi:hypothetical protein
MTNSLDAIPADTFAMLRDLIAILADPKRSTEVLTELESRAKAAKAAENRLGTVRERHEIAMARERQELDERRGNLAKKASELMMREAEVNAREKTLERARIIHRDPAMLTGLTREIGDGQQTTG